MGGGLQVGDWGREDQIRPAATFLGSGTASPAGPPTAAALGEGRGGASLAAARVPPCHPSWATRGRGPIYVSSLFSSNSSIL